jgi:hypothetical protein
LARVAQVVDLRILLETLELLAVFQQLQQQAAAAARFTQTQLMVVQSMAGQAAAGTAQ